MSGKRKPLVRCKDTSSSGSDEDSFTVENQRLLTSDTDELGAAVSPGGSSTASGPVCVRTPGFNQHAQEFSLKKITSGSCNVQTSSVSKGKKIKALEENGPLTLSKCSVPFNGLKPSLEEPTVVRENVCKQNPIKFRMKKEPLPMKLRALPQSFWQQPNATIDISPGQIYAKLPPLLSKDVSDDMRNPCSSSTEIKNDTKPQSHTKSFLRVSDTDWIFQLFDVLDHNSKTPPTRRGRPKKVLPVPTSRVLRMEDPVLGIAATETIIPQTSSGDKSLTFQPPTLTMISLKDRDKSISLPALNIEKNYSQMLSEVVVKL